MKCVTNTVISDKILLSELFLWYLQECFERALVLEERYQLSKGINLPHVANVMSIQYESCDTNEIRSNDT